MCKTKLTIFNRVQITRTRTKYSDHVGQVYQVRVEAPRGRQDAGRLADHTPSLLLRGLGLILGMSGQNKHFIASSEAATVMYL